MSYKTGYLGLNVDSSQNGYDPTISIIVMYEAFLRGVLDKSECTEDEPIS